MRLGEKWKRAEGGKKNMELDWKDTGRGLRTEKKEEGKLRRSEKRGGHAETSFKFRSKFYLDRHLHAVIPLLDKNRQNAAAVSGPIWS